MVGNATLTIVASSTTINCATAMSARTAFASTPEAGRGIERAVAVAIRPGSGSLVVFGREQVAHGEAPIWPPAIRHLSHFLFGRKLIEAIRSLDRASEREVAGQKDIGTLKSDEQEPARGPRPDSGHLGQGC